MPHTQVQKEEERDVPVLHIDEVQTELYVLLTLFYSGIGIVQRDAPKETETEDGSATLRLENNVQEIIGHFITTKERLMKKIADIEHAEKQRKKDIQKHSRETEMKMLIEETRKLDSVLKQKIATMENDLPMIKAHISELIDKMSKV